MRVLVVGKGVVGDATGYCLGRRGHEIVYHDPPRGLEGSIEGVDCALICVPTPRGALGYNSRSQVYRTADLLEHRGYRGPVGVRSTVVMGTCDELQLEFPMMTWFSWPEFLRAERAREMAGNPPYRVIGFSHWDEPAYAPLRARLLELADAIDTDPTCRLVRPVEAEFIKYATNALLAGAVGLANELSELAEAYGLNWNALVPPIAQMDGVLPGNVRVIDPGGFGGACLPKDLAALLFHAARDKGVELPVLSAIEAENLRRRPGDAEGSSLGAPNTEGTASVAPSGSGR